MKLIWNGHSCFTLATEAGTLVIDPYEDGSVPGLSPLHLEADAVYCSHEHRDHGNRAAVALSGKPCAVEVEELATWHDEAQGAKRGPNTMRIFSAEGLRVAHLGDLGCGLTPEQPPPYVDMTVREYLEFAAGLKRIPRGERAAQLDRILEMTRTADVSGRLIRNLSKGYRQRVGLAQALIGFPHILILDEPTVGLDPKQILEIRALIRELAQEHTVILSSHILSEVQEVCDHIFIIHHGRLVAQGTPAQLERELAGTPAITLLLKAAPEEGRVLLSGVPGVAEVAPLPCGEAGAALLRLTPAEGADPREAVFRACAGADLPILEMRRESLSLEQIFLELTSDASAAGQAGGRRRPFGRRDSAEPEPAPETAITEHGEEAEP